MKNVFILVITVAVFIPILASAEETGLIPAICEQVLTPDEDTSIPKIIFNRFKGVPSMVALSLKEVVDDAASEVAEDLESLKRSDDSNAVLGASTQSFVDPAINKGIDALTFLLRHWMWTLSGLALLTLGWFMRF